MTSLRSVYMGDIPKNVSLYQKIVIRGRDVVAQSKDRIGVYIERLHTFSGQNYMHFQGRIVLISLDSIDIFVRRR